MTEPDDASRDGVPSILPAGLIGETPLRGAAAGAGGVRSRYVVGIFGRAAIGPEPAKRLSAGPCDVLVLIPSGSDVMADEGLAGVAVYRVAPSDAPASDLAAAVGAFAPFAVLGHDRLAHAADAARLPWTPRLFENLSNHIAAGAAVVLVRVPDTDLQRQVSRALLDARCDVLLTHDVLSGWG